MIRSPKDSPPKCTLETNISKVGNIIEMLPVNGGQKFTRLNLPHPTSQQICASAKIHRPTKNSAKCVKITRARIFILANTAIVLLLIILGAFYPPKLDLPSPLDGETSSHCSPPKHEPPSGKNSPKISTTFIRSVPDLYKITNQTAQITLETSNILVWVKGDRSDFNWSCLPRIEHPTEVEIRTLTRDWHFIHDTVNWLSLSISNLTVDAKLFNCSLDKIEPDDTYDPIVLSKLSNLHLKNISACFITKFVTVFKFPNIESVNIHGSDEKETYHRTLITLFRGQSEKFTSLTTLCTNKCKK